MTNQNGKNGSRGLASADEAAKERVTTAGGEAVSQDREHMSEIGRRGGEEVLQDMEHMSEIEREGGQPSHGGGRSGDSNQGGSTGRGFAGMSDEEQKHIARVGSTSTPQPSFLFGV